MKIGFLPLYIKLYDDVVPDRRPRMEAFYEKIASLLEARGLTVIRSSFCRLEEEFRAAVHSFEREGADAIVTLHIAYSPSLESIGALTDTDLPIIVLDTTETLEFTNEQSEGEIMYNHGIHGVMDMCSMLTRCGKPYAVAAGHWEESDVIDRACGYVRAAAAARALRCARVGLIGGSFAGMGDFRVPFSEMKERFGIRIVESDRSVLRGYMDSLTEAEIAAEIADNEASYDFSGPIDPAEYREAVRSCLATRKFVADNALTAFTANFLKTGPSGSGITSTPFLEACKAMQNGVGYAGEGDTLTAAFVGALLQGYPETNFVEIFCPDWKNDLLFLSHMGELNYRIAAVKPCIRRAGTKYGPDDVNPYVGYTRMKGGRGVYVNVSRAKDDFRLFLASCEMQDCDHDSFPGSMRGWMKPTGRTTAQFLESISRSGATHHSAFVYGATVEELAFFGRIHGMDIVIA
jgi:L-arabinose isomerase